MAQAIQERKATNGAGATTALAVLKRDTVDVVAGRINELMRSGELHLPADYSVHNALKSAWLVLQETVDKDKRPVLSVCSRESIANALLDMAIQGLNPAKRQCYFIAYGSQLVCQRSYFGDMALVKRILPRAEIWFNVVYEGDEFEYQFERGRRVITKHNQRIENVKPDKIVAAYCVIEPGDGRPAHTEIMTWAQIQQSWRQSKQFKPEGGTTPHHTFPDQMALRTVIRRACKAVINSSSDDYLLLHHMHRSDEVAAEAEAAQYANGQVIDVEPEVVDDAGAADEPAPAGPALEPEPQRETAGAQSSLLDGPGF
ncbi:MAG: hypothetical protein BAA04_09725 [Firmicutes bacterium ZCTH02-B6]|nr:MAG: hypothetical protein BAA04_09725 [Firmicutes bacterium ZCTH02-B6]